MSFQGNTAIKLVFVTSNKGKLQEVRDWLLPKLPACSEVAGKALNLEELQTLDLKALVRSKSQQAASQIVAPLLVDDTALCFDTWNGLPGPFVRFFIDRLTPQGLFEALDAGSNCNAKAICVLGYHDGHQIHCFQAQVAGSIVAPRGEGGFGWDALFQPAGSRQTLAEMTAATRHQFSMRARALEQLTQHLLTQHL